MNDREAYDLYPEDNWVYDKTEIAKIFEVKCGHLIPDNKEYCVKPKMNLDGCSIGSRFVKNIEGFTVPEGHHWFEKLKGIHWTCDFFRDGNSWNMRNCFYGEMYPNDHTRFQFWKRLDQQTIMDNNLTLVLKTCMKVLHNIRSAPIVNFEFLGLKAIECHLRGNTDPVEYDVIIPDWDGIYRNKDQMIEQGYDYIVDKEDHPGRKGFWVK